MLATFYVAVGGGAGAILRFWTTNLAVHFLGRGFPWGVLLVNVLGSLLIGMAWVIIVERAVVDAQLRNLLMVGFLGGLTTFSTFSMDSLSMIEGGAYGKAMIYVLASVVLCLIATWIGLKFGRSLGWQA